MDKDLTPLGELLEAARLARRPKLSQNALAKLAETSGTTYRRVITGTSRFGGQDIAFGGSAETVARIAHAVDVTPEQLEAADRADAAEELRILTGERQGTATVGGQAMLSATGTARYDDPDAALANLPADRQQAVSVLRALLNQVREDNARSNERLARILAELDRITLETG